MQQLEKGLTMARARSATLHAVEPSDVVELSPEQESSFDLARLHRVEPNPQLLAESRVFVEELSTARSAFKMLRTRVLQRMRSNGWKTIAVTGTCPGEGKSLTAINLSINLAKDPGTSVVLVDLDLRKPSIHRHLGIIAQCGIGDVFRGTATLEQAAVCPGVDRLGVVLNDESFPNSSELLASPRTASLVNRVKHGDGRIAVFDLPPLLASDDMLAFCPCVDAVLLVVAQGETRRADMTAARDLLQNVDIVGVVLNQCSEQLTPYYYYGAATR